MRLDPRFLGFLVAIVLALVSAQGAAYAQSNNPVGQWTMTAFDDTSANLIQLGTQTVCFRANNTWYGTFPGWRGNWFQKGLNAGGNGNRVRIVGNFLSLGNTGTGNDSAEFEFVSSNFMTAYWNEWLDLNLDGTGFVLYLRITATRTGNACTFAPVPPATFQDPNDERLGPFDIVRSSNK